MNAPVGKRMHLKGKEVAGPLCAEVQEEPREVNEKRWQLGREWGTGGSKGQDRKGYGCTHGNKQSRSRGVGVGAA